MIVLDVETTGLNPEKNSLVSIGALNFYNPQDRFYEECRIWDGAEVRPEALVINGYTEAGLRDPSKKTEADIILKFFDWLSSKSDITVAGQNCYMDLQFVEAAARRAGSKERMQKRIFEQHSIVMFHMLKRGITPPIKDRRSALDSDVIMTYVGIPIEPKPHIAINGAIWEYEVLYRLVYEKPGLDDFKQYPIPWLNKATL
ncbi:MAG: 3'-5' exonuclease [bacterium]|nr:3'-5' exonuclease [bacterium]